MHDERKIHRHGVVALVDHRLGEIERRDARAVEPFVVEQNLVHAGTISKRRREHVRKARAHVIGVEHRVFRRLLQSVGPMGQHESIGANEHAHLSMERGEAAERCVVRAFDEVQSVFIARDERRRCEGREALGQNDGPGAGRGARPQPGGPGAAPAAAVWRRERLVQIDVHGVDAEIARPRLAHQRVEVGAVAIKIRARRVYGFRDFDDVALE
jgi:hypothetical protein